jgi:hypothetical protein
MGWRWNGVYVPESKCTTSSRCFATSYCPISLSISACSDFAIETTSVEVGAEILNPELQGMSRMTDGVSLQF